MAMTTLLCFGLGYSAQHYLASYGGRFERVWATVRDAERVVDLNSRARPGITALAFDGTVASADLRSAIAQAEAVLVSVPPDSTGDPVLGMCAEALTLATRLHSIVYLSTVGVYGNYEGAWVDEESECRPSEERNRQRLAAERAWQDLGIRTGVPVAILRVAGIYGPGRNALENVRRNTAKRIAKPGQVFNRIHVTDIAQAIDAAFESRPSGIFNVADDEPTPPGDPIVFAARLLGVEPPQEIPFAQARATMTEFAASFYADARRVRNVKLKSVLGVTLRYPTYREGLSVLHHDGEQISHGTPAS
jgi:nucleoside-diphosphate-sugar epimerase